jgi:hypothetical protein
MISSSKVACKGAHRAGAVAVLVVVSAFLSASSAYAQADGDLHTTPAATDINVDSTGRQFGGIDGGSSTEGAWTRRFSIRRSLATLDYSAVAVAHDTPAPAFRTSSGAQQRSIGRKVASGVIGAVGGFFAGGFLGAQLEPACHCDDPGLQGFVIGAPIGAVIGGILGFHFF